jgi:hypothetical protein
MTGVSSNIERAGDELTDIHAEVLGWGSESRECGKRFAGLRRKVPFLTSELLCLRQHRSASLATN